MGPRRPGRAHLQRLGSSGPDSALEVKDLPPKAWADSLPIRITGPLCCLNPEVPVNWGQGGRPVPSCGALHALHNWLRRRSSEKMEGMSEALSAQLPLPPPCTDEETTGPERTNRMWSLGGCHCPSGFPRPWTHNRVWPLHGPRLMSPGRAQEASQPRHEVSALLLSAWSNPLLQKVGLRFSF